jgi:hypothetical protein
MKLYHGTSARIGRLALEQGLRSRKATKTKGNWEHSSLSRIDAIYLSVAYAPYFAMMTEHENKIAIIEVESDRLAQKLLVPDEDAIEQASRMAKTDDDGCSLEWEMKQRTAYYRKNLHRYDDGQWEDSVKLLGNCAYLSSVPAHKITRVAFLDVRDHKAWAGQCLDPTITVLNYRFVGEKYRLLTSAVFGGEIPPEPEHEKLIRDQMIALNPNAGKHYKSTWDICRELDHTRIKLVTPSK